MERLIAFFLFLLLPLVEIAGFVLVGRVIGVFATIGLVLLSGVVGVALLRGSGLAALGRVSRELQAGRDPGRELADGAMLLFAGILFVIPGFFTDLIALPLLLPSVRKLIWSRFGKSLAMRVDTYGFGGEAPKRRAGPVIDLEEGDFTRTDPTGPQSARGDSPWKRLDDG